MLATDFSPNRLEAAKESALEFINQLPSQTKVGIISFSGASYIKQRPSNDQNLAKDAVRSIETELIAGTGIGEVIITATNVLLAEKPSNSIILITDGQNNIGASIAESIEYAKNHQITVNTIGIGTKEGGTFTNFNESVISKVNFEDLQLIAKETNGKSYLANNELDIKNAYNEIINLKEGSKKIDLANYLLLLSLFILIIEIILMNTRYRTIP